MANVSFESDQMRFINELRTNYDIETSDEYAGNERNDHQRDDEVQTDKEADDGRVDRGQHYDYGH